MKQTYKVLYRNTIQSGDIIGRGMYIQATSIIQAEKIATDKCKVTETIEQIKLFKLD